MPFDGLALVPGVKKQRYDIDFVEGMALLAGSLDQRLTLVTHVPSVDLNE
jgi:hypothetical protein